MIQSSLTSQENFHTGHLFKVIRYLNIVIVVSNDNCINILCICKETEINFVTLDLDFVYTVNINQV